jgi:hypothetical protein
VLKHPKTHLLHILSLLNLLAPDEQPLLQHVHGQILRPKDKDLPNDACTSTLEPSTLQPFRGVEDRGGTLFTELGNNTLGRDEWGTELDTLGWVFG